MIKIVVDLMGADKPANELVSGAIDAINENSDLMVTLCAKKDIIMPVLETLSYNKDQVEIIDCSELQIMIFQQRPLEKSQIQA